MTGYGKAIIELTEKIVTIELKSLNSKQLDLYVRLPNAYRDREVDFRNEIANRLKRGKIEVVLTVENKEGKQAVKINRDIVKDYYHQVKNIADELGISENGSFLQTILRLPDALNNDREVVNKEETDLIFATLIKAIDELDRFRSVEGASLVEDIIKRIGIIESLLNDIEPLEKERTENFRKKLDNSLLSFLPNESINKDRFEQELIYYLEKLDITEEKTRLSHHCGYFREVINEPDQVGRKLGFVAQEIGREINTIGSKANHSGIQKLVVLMKDELEKIKEQLMNVL